MESDYTLGLRQLRFCVALAAACIGLGFIAEARAQDTSAQQPSVADAARQARKQKKDSAKPKVITDDDLPPHAVAQQEGIPVGGPPDLETQPPSRAAIAKAEAADEAPEKQAAEDAKEEDPEIARLEKQVLESEKELDLLKRELALDNESYYSNPDYANDPAGKAKLDDEQQQINAKQQEVDELKARLAVLREHQPPRRKAKSAQQAPPEQSEKPESQPPQP